MRACAITLDLDGPSEYAGIHGLARTDFDPLVMYGAPLKRFLEICDDLDAPPTLFVIGRDLANGAREILRAVENAELAAHSFAHDYSMSTYDAPAVLDDIQRVRETFVLAFGKPPVGFRAPGYLVSKTMLDALEACGFAYDSSVLPSPSYYAVKAAVLTAYRLGGAHPASRYGDPRMGFAPTEPYRLGIGPFEMGQRKLHELPIAVSTIARLPLTATAIMLAPRVLRQTMLTSPLDVLVVNAHAMDFVDAKTDGIPDAIVQRQPELRIPVDERMEILRMALQTLLDDRDAATCSAIAGAL